MNTSNSSASLLVTWTFGQSPDDPPPDHTAPLVTYVTRMTHDAHRASRRRQSRGRLEAPRDVIFVSRRFRAPPRRQAPTL